MNIEIKNYRVENILRPTKETIDTKLLTLDLETRMLEGCASAGSLEVISSCIYDGSRFHSYYITDFLANQVSGSDAIGLGIEEFNYKTASHKLLKATINKLVDPSFNGFSCYVHNLSKFDIIFLFKEFLSLKKSGYQIDFTKRDDNFISFTISKYVIKEVTKKGEKVKIKNLVFKLVLYDSLLLLPSSLQKLSKSFNVPGKLEFNVLDNNTADLSCPDFKSKLLEYNLQDCKVLYEIIKAFNLNFIDLFNINILKSPTLPSLAFKLFKSKYLGDHKIPIT